MNIVKEYRILPDYQIWLHFEDGYQGIVNLKPFLGKGLATQLLDTNEFNKLTIESGGGLAWENGFDICPNSLRELAQGKVHMAKQ